jgi:hypothetical protein
MGPTLIKHPSERRRRTTHRILFETLESRVPLSPTPDTPLAVQLTSPAAVSSFDQVATSAGATVQSTRIPGLLQVQGSSSSLAAVAAAAAGNPDVQYAQPEQTVQAALTPNAPEFTAGNLWGLNGTWGINAPAAWNVTTGAPASVTIADLDTGADYNHPDLYENI